MDHPSLHEPFPLPIADPNRWQHEAAVNELKRRLAKSERENEQLRRELAELRARKSERVDELILGGPSIGEE